MKRKAFRPDWYYLSVLLIIFLSVWTFGCAAKGKVNTEPAKPADPVKERKNEFTERYGFFLNDKEKKELQVCPTVECVDTFIEEFWSGNKEKGKPSRDPDPNTPENELKAEIDSRIEDIRNEIFALDGIQFKANGGLRGDLAHVYLFYGRPSYMDRLPEGQTYVEMAVWYYFDSSEQHLFRFLFYEKMGKLQVFKKYMTIMSFEYLLDPLTSPLREISKRMAVTPQELYELWSELLFNDQSGAFRLALMEFSYYTDIKIDDALSAPEAAAVTAERFKSRILGQPDVPEGLEIVPGSRKSYIRGRAEIVKDQKSGNYTFTVMTRVSDVDWEVKKDSEGNSAKDRVEAAMTLRISFQDLETKRKTEFLSGVNIGLPRVVFDRNMNESLPLSFGNIRNQKSGQAGETLGEFLNDLLEPGTYVVDLYLRHNLTKKPLIWTGEITIE